MNQALLSTIALIATGLLGTAPTSAMSPSRTEAVPPARAVGQEVSANTAIVQSLYQAFAAGDGATINGLLAADLVWIEAESGPYADRNPYNGPGAVFEGVFGRIGAEFEGFAATPESYLASGDQIVAFGRYTGTNKATGEALDAQFTHVFTVTDGKISRFQQYTDTAQWVDVVTPD